MRLIILATVLTACGGTSSTSAESIGETPATSMSASPSASASPAAGIERLCEAFDIVNREISPAYTELSESDMDAIALGMAGLTIVTAGADIEELAEGVAPENLADSIREMGQRYQEEGEAVQDGDLSSMRATDFYLDLVEEYGGECR